MHFFSDEAVREAGVLMSLIGKCFALLGGAAWSGVKAAAPAAGGALLGAGKAMTDAATPVVMDAANSAIETAAPYIQDATSQIADAAAPHIDNLAGQLATASESVVWSSAPYVDGAVDGVTSTIQGAADTASQLVAPVKEATDSVVSQIPSAELPSVDLPSVELPSIELPFKAF